MAGHRLTEREIALALALTDASVPWEESGSCIVAAVREARVLTGRDPDTGTAPAPNPNEMTFAGALVYFVVLEQLGAGFVPAEVTGPSVGEALRASLVHFAEIPMPEANILVGARHRFAHEYNLRGPNGGRVYEFASEGPPVVEGLTRTRISLPAIGDTAERALAAVRAGLQDGTVTVRPAPGIGELVRRFTMQFGPS